MRCPECGSVIVREVATEEHIEHQRDGRAVKVVATEMHDELYSNEGCLYCQVENLCFFGEPGIFF
jgi:hypothetical protein